MIIDLCAGRGGWTAPFDDAGWETAGIDIRNSSGADIVADVSHLPLDANPTLITASPPCTEFSAAWNSVTPPHERDPDKSVWRSCLGEIHRLDPDWWIVENVAQAQYWFGPSDKHIGPYHFWGYFPPFDAAQPKPKTQATPSGNRWVADSEDAAEIPYYIANALRRSVEVFDL